MTRPHTPMSSMRGGEEDAQGMGVRAVAGFARRSPTLNAQAAGVMVWWRGWIRRTGKTD